jgi:ABC-type Zn uptake system ZnuABC Zn-binding protein ZnuA
VTRTVPIALALVLASAVSACGPAVNGSSDGRLVVVATSTVFADMVANVGGALVDARSVVPKNTDVHTFEPRPSDVRAVAAAKLLVMNGLGFDDWLEKTISNAGVEGTPLLTLGLAVSPDGAGATFAPDANPHLWLDVRFGIDYVESIATALGKVDPDHAATYGTNAQAYVARLTALDGAIRTTFDAIPAARRRIVTFHDAFPYFAKAYGLEIVGVAVEAPGQDPSAGEISALIEAIRAAGVRAIFSERQFPTRLVDRVAAETDAKVVANLYSDSLGDAPIDSYEALMRWDADRIAEALR